jgi:large subunit ribosomal protein L44e
MVHYPKSKNTYCKEAGKHIAWKVTQYKKGKDSTTAQGKRRYDAKQKGFGGQTKPVFRKKAKLTKKTTIKLEAIIKDKKTGKERKIKRCYPIKRCRSFVLGKKEKTKGQVMF